MGRDLAGEGVAELERTLVDAHGRLDVDAVIHGIFPVALGVLADDSLVELDLPALIVPKGDVGRAVRAVVVIDRNDPHVGELHIGANVGGGEGGDGRGLGRQGQTGGLLIGGRVQLGQVIVDLEVAGGDDGVAQTDVGRLRGHVGADAAGGVLQVDVPAVHQRHNTFNGEAGAGLTGQRLGNGVILRLRRFFHALADELVEREAEGILVQPAGAGAVGGEGGDAAVPLHIHVAVCTGQVAAGDVVCLVRRDTVAERPLGAAGRVAAQIE